MLEDLYIEQDKVPKGFIVFNIMRKMFCLDINNVLTIISTKELNQSQFFFNYSTNTINYHGEIFPLVEFNVHYNLKFSVNDISKHLIFLNYKGNKIALFVDQIVDYIATNNSMIDQIKYVPTQRKSFINGQIQYEGKSFLMLDLDQILETFKQRITFEACNRNKSSLRYK